MCMRFVHPSHDCRHSDPPTACILIDVYVFLSSPKLGTEPCCVNTLSSERAWAASSALCSDPWLCATLVVRLVDTGNIIQTQSPHQCRMFFLARIDGHVDKKQSDARRPPLVHQLGGSFSLNFVNPAGPCRGQSRIHPCDLAGHLPWPVHSQPGHLPWPAQPARLANFENV